MGEAKRFCENLPKFEVKPLSNMKPEIMKQIIELNESAANEASSAIRVETIRKLTAIVTRFDAKRSAEKTYFEYCMYEACVQLCMLKPALLTRRDDLMKFARQLLKNVGIAETSTNGKRTSMSNSLPTDLSMNKRIKTEAPAENFYQNAFNAYSNLMGYDKNYMQQFPAPMMPNLPNSFWPYGENNVSDTMKYQEEMRKKLFTHHETPDKINNAPLGERSAYGHHSDKNEAKNLRANEYASDVNVDEENEEDDTVNKSRETNTSDSSSSSESGDDDDDEDQDSYVAGENDDEARNDGEESQHDAESESAVNNLKDDFNEDYDSYEAKTDPNNNKN